MTTIDDMWFLAVQASERAERAYHRLDETHADFLETTRRRRVSRPRFRTLAERVRTSGAPFGAHSIVYRNRRLLLVRHEGVDMWVLPGGEVDGDETFRQAAQRELAEEAGLSAAYEGLAIATRVEFVCGDHTAWGVLPVFAARPRSTEPTVADPDGEISDARWFDFEDLPPDTRDRSDLLEWYERRY